MYFCPAAMFGSGGSEPLKSMPVKVACPVKVGDGVGFCGCPGSGGPDFPSEAAGRGGKYCGSGVIFSCQDAVGGASGSSESRGDSTGPDRCPTTDAACAGATPAAAARPVANTHPTTKLRSHCLRLALLRKDNAVLSVRVPGSATLSD